MVREPRVLTPSPPHTPNHVNVLRLGGRREEGFVAHLGGGQGVLLADGAAHLVDDERGQLRQAAALEDGLGLKADLRLLEKGKRVVRRGQVAQLCGGHTRY